MKQKINSRQKGKRVERDAVKFLHSLGYTDARRTAQVRGKDSGCADIECPSLGCHIEVKGDRSIGLGTKALDAACEQAIRDGNTKTEWVVLWQEHRKGWRLTWTTQTFKTIPVWATVAGSDISTVLAMFRKASA